MLILHIILLTKQAEYLKVFMTYIW